MTLDCDICHKTYSSRRSLKKHRKDIHQIHSAKPEFQCADCMNVLKTIAGLNRHVESVHGKRVARICIYCHIAFLEEHSFVNHMEQIHSLPVWNSAHSSPSNRPTKTCFNGAVKTFDFYPNETDIDLLEYFSRMRAEFGNMLATNALECPQKYQFVVMVSLFKPCEEIEGEKQRITIHVNTKFQPVFQNGLTSEQSEDCINQLLTSLISFVGHGSGWCVESLDKVTLKMAAFSPIRGSTYLKLPAALAANHGNLLNIRNQKDNKCFSYCFTAAYHLKFGPTLLEGKS